MRKLTVLVTCTYRKSLPADDRLLARNLPSSGVDARGRTWRSRLTKATSTRPLRQLYQGDTWAQVAILSGAAERAGYTPRVLVASAGLGLRELDHLGPGYGATFSPGADDLVARAEDHPRWWRSLRELPGALSLTEALRGRAIMVLSAPYAVALRGDLCEAATGGGEFLLIGGAADVPGVTRLPADRGLRNELGGTAGSLSLRMATRWLERLNGRELTSRSAMQSWRSWASSVRRPDVWDRRPMTDTQVSSAIRGLLDEQPDLSRTRALRQLRDSGRACEQRRFADLFAQVRATL